MCALSVYNVLVHVNCRVCKICMNYSLQCWYSHSLPLSCILNPNLASNLSQHFLSWSCAAPFDPFAILHVKQVHIVHILEQHHHGSDAACCGDVVSLQGAHVPRHICRHAHRSAASLSNAQVPNVRSPHRFTPALNARKYLLRCV